MERKTAREFANPVKGEIEMSKYKQNGLKSERISLRCTKNEKKKLLERVDALEMDVTDYIRSVLFPQGPYKEITRNAMGLMIDIQALIVHIKEIYKEDNI